jgi:hypothetical protein
MIFGESFNAIFDAIRRIEEHVGLRYYTDDESVNGRLNNLEFRQSESYIPCCEVDVEISDNNFYVSYDPILIGDAWTVNNSVLIKTYSGTDGETVVDEWGDIEFNGNRGTLLGANGRYDGMTLTVTYFHRNVQKYYTIVFKDGYPETEKKAEEMFDLVIEDDSLDKNQRIFIDSKGRVSSYSVDDDVSGNNIFVDEINGNEYELYADGGHISWRQK